MTAPPAGSGGTRNNGNQDSHSSRSGGGGTLEAAPTGTGLAALLTAAAGPGERYAGLDDAALAGAVRRWADEESWCHGRMLAAVREMIRRRPLAGHGGQAPRAGVGAGGAAAADRGGAGCRDPEPLAGPDDRQRDLGAVRRGRPGGGSGRGRVVGREDLAAA